MSQLVSSCSQRDGVRSEVKRVNELCVNTLIDAFQQHTELMCQVSRLVAAGAQQSKSTFLSPLLWWC